MSALIFAKGLIRLCRRRFKILYMKWFYIYGICPASGSAKILPVKGIDKRGRVFTMPYKGIEAVASEVSLKEFNSNEIQQKATEDIQWIKDKAILHEKIIEAASKHQNGQVIPMKFGSIFKSRKSLADSLKKGYARFKSLLERLSGKEERSMKVYLDSRPFENEIKRRSQAIQRRLEESKSLPAGRQYFLEKDADETVKVEAKKSVNRHIPIFIKRLNQWAEDMRENKILGNELTQRNEPMVFNGAFLVKKAKVNRFQKEIRKLRAEYKKAGFIFDSSGPWPPYNFV